jgi:putative transposase
VTDVTDNEGQAEAELSAADEQVLRELTERARTGGLRLTGEGGLLGRLTKMVIEGALEGELDDHLGYGNHDPEGRELGGDPGRCSLIAMQSSSASRDTAPGWSSASRRAT